MCDCPQVLPLLSDDTVTQTQVSSSKANFLPCQSHRSGPTAACGPFPFSPGLWLGHVHTGTWIHTGVGHSQTRTQTRHQDGGECPLMHIVTDPHLLHVKSPGLRITCTDMCSCANMQTPVGSVHTPAAPDPSLVHRCLCRWPDPSPTLPVCPLEQGEVLSLGASERRQGGLGPSSLSGWGGHSGGCLSLPLWGQLRDRAVVP